MPGSSTTQDRKTRSRWRAPPFCRPLMTTASASRLILSRLNGWPIGAPPDASPPASRPTTHGSGPMRFAIPSPQWTGATYSSPASRRTVMSGRRPLSRVSLKLLRTSRVRSCLRPVDAGSRSPLALMKIRLALRPNHRIALVAAQTVQRASKPCPLVHITSPSPSMPIALRRNLLLEEPLVRPRPDGRRIDRPSSSARKRCARPCWRAPPRSA